MSLLMIILLLPPLLPLLHRSRKRLLATDRHFHPHPPHLTILTMSHPRITIIRGPGLLRHEVVNLRIGEFLEVPVAVELLHQIGKARRVGTGFGRHDRGGGGVVERVGVVVVTGGGWYVVPSVGTEVRFGLRLIQAGGGEGCLLLLLAVVRGSASAVPVVGGGSGIAVFPSRERSPAATVFLIGSDYGGGGIVPECVGLTAHTEGRCGDCFSQRE